MAYCSNCPKNQDCCKWVFRSIISSPIKKYRPMSSTMNFHERYPIVDIEQNRVLANNGNIAYAYRVELPEIYSLSEADFEELHGQWFQALKSLPMGTLVHKQDIYRKISYDASRLPKGSFLAKATRD